MLCRPGSGLKPNDLAEYVYDSYLMKYGMHSLADERVIELVSTVRGHRAGLVRAELLGRLLEMWEPLPSEGRDFFVRLFGALASASAAKGVHATSASAAKQKGDGKGGGAKGSAARWLS